MLRVRVEDKAGAPLGTLTDPQALEWSVARNDAGAIKLTYPRGTEPGELLATYDRAAYLVVPAPWGDEFYLLDDDADTTTDEAGPLRPLEVGGRGMLGELIYGRVYPRDHVPGEAVAGYQVGGHPFVDATPGQIMATLMQRAQARGALARFTIGFSSTHDSAGALWPLLYTREWPAGTDLLKVVMDMVEGGWVDVRMTGTRLDLYLPDTLAVDHPQAVFRLAQNVRQGPRQRTRADVRTVLMTSGDLGNVIETTDAAGLAAYGRREAYDGRSGVSDPDMLTQLAGETLAGLSAPSQTFTLAWIPDDNTPEAGVTFREGDWIRYDQRRIDSQTLEPLRVQSLAFAYAGDNAYPVCSAELADRWIEADVARKRRVDALTLASQSPWAVPKENPQLDTVGPLAPDSLTIAVSIAARPRASLLDAPTFEPTLTLSWPTVTRNEDGTVYDDPGEYLISTRYPAESLDAEWTAEESAQAGPIVLTGFPWDTNVSARIRAVDTQGNSSPYTYAVSVRTWQAYATQPAPSTPTVATKLGRVWVTWDGLKAGGGTFSAPFVGIEVHASSQSGFPPTDATRVEFMVAPTGGMTVVIPPQSYSAPTYVKLVPVDSLGQRGTASAQASVTATQLVPADIADGSVTSAKLADLTVVAAKIVDGAVNDAKITSVSAGAITAGSLSAGITVVGRLATASTGARVQMYQYGLVGVNAANQATVYIEAATGNAWFAGSITAAEFTSTIAMRSTSITGANVTLEAYGIVVANSGGAIGLRSGYGGAMAPGALIAVWDSRTIGENFRIGTYLRSEATDVYEPASGQGARRHVIMEASYGMSANQVRLWTLTANVSTATNPRRLSSGEPTHKFTAGHSGSVYIELKTTNALTRPASDPLYPNTVDYSECWLQVRNVGGAIEVWTEAVDMTATFNAQPSAQATGEGTTSMRAAAFSGQSGSAAKTGIRPPVDRAVDVVLANPAHTWAYRQGDGRRRLGPLADDLPEYLLDRPDDGRLFLDGNSELGLLWQAIAEVDAELTAAGV